jgi:hypothetical protein
VPSYANEHRYDFTVDGLSFLEISIQDVKPHRISTDSGKEQLTNLSAQHFLKQLEAHPCLFQVEEENVAPSNGQEADSGHEANRLPECLFPQEEYFLVHCPTSNPV